MPQIDSSLPLVSVVTPAYNEEKYLSECIESVLAQSYTHWDYLIVDNCSTDSTLSVARKYAARDPRIRVISNNSLIPATANFNCGLRRISSESKYCKIVLADDWMFPQCLEQMVALMEAHPTVGIAGAYGLQGQWVLWEGVPYTTQVVSGREICRQRLLGGPYVFGSPSSVLFRCDLVRKRDPFYNESNMHAADSEACFELLKDCDFGFVHQVLTFSRQREGSLLQSSMELNASAGDLLRELAVYGPSYLAADEQAKRLNTVLSKYYDFLAVNLLHRRGRFFWDYHRGRMKEVGVAFSWLSVATTLGQKVLHRFLPRTAESAHRWGL